MTKPFVAGVLALKRGCDVEELERSELEQLAAGRDRVGCRGQLAQRAPPVEAGDHVGGRGRDLEHGPRSVLERHACAGHAASLQQRLHAQLVDRRNPRVEQIVPVEARTRRRTHA